MTGPGTWPLTYSDTGQLHRASLRLERPAVALALVTEMEAMIEDRGGMWRTWNTAMEAIARGVDGVRELTIEALVVPG